MRNRCFGWIHSCGKIALGPFLYLVGSKCLWWNQIEFLLNPNPRKSEFPSTGAAKPVLLNLHVKAQPERKFGHTNLRNTFYKKRGGAGGSIHLARLTEWIPIFILMTTSHHTKKTNLVFRIWEIHSSGQTCRVKSACQSSSWRKISSKIQLLFKIGLSQEFILIELPYYSTTRPVKRLAILAQDGSTKAIWDEYPTKGYKWMGLGLGWKSPGGAMLRAPLVPITCPKRM